MPDQSVFEVMSTLTYTNVLYLLYDADDNDNNNNVSY